MKRGTIIDPEERERRIKAIADERDRGKRQHMAYGLANEILLTDKRRRNPSRAKPKPAEPAPLKPGPWQSLDRLADLMQRKKNGGDHD